MTIILRMQHLPWSATSMDIRRYFTGLSIPDGGVHIVGGENGDVFIAFSSDENARRAMQIQNRPLCGNKIVLMLSSKSEMQEVIARNRALAQSKSDPFQAESRSQGQSPVPTNQPIMETGGGSLQKDRDFAGYKGPSKSQPPIASGQFDPKPQNKTLLPSGDPPGAASNSPQRPVGDSLLGIPPYGNQPPDPALGRKPGYFSDPNAGFQERNDEMFPSERRQGEPLKRPLVDARHKPDITADHAPRGDAPSGEDHHGGNSFRDRGGFPKQPLVQVPGDMDSRLPPGRRAPLLEHEPRRQDVRSSFGHYDDARTGESMPNEPHNKRLKSGHESLPPYDHRAPLPDEERFGHDRQWDRPFEDTKQGFPGKQGPEEDRMLQRGPMHDDGARYDPDSRWPQSGPRIGPDGQRFSGDPFGLNDPYDDQRGSGDPRDREGGRGGFDAGRRGPMEQLGLESYRKGEEPFSSGRDQRYHDAGGPTDRMGRDRDRNRFDPGEHRGPGDHINDRRGPSDFRREKMPGVENRGPGEGMGHEDRRGPRMDRGTGGHAGLDEKRGAADHRGPERRMGFEEGRVPGEPRDADSRFGPEDPIHRPKDDFMSKDIRFEQGMRQGERTGPDDFMDSVGRMGPGDPTGPRDFMNPDQMARGSQFGSNDRLPASDLPGPGGAGERRGPGDPYGLEERMRGGSGERFGPVDHMGPGNRMGHGDFMEPRDFVAGDRPGSGMGRGDRNLSEDRRGSGEPFRQGGRFGRDGPLGPDDHGPSPQRLTPDRQQGRRMLLERHDPSDRSRPDDHSGPHDSFGRDQWRPKGNNARPSLLGQPGMSDQDNVGPRGPADYLDLGLSRPMGPGGRRDAGQGDRQGPNSRMTPEDLEPISRLRKESRFGPPIDEKSMDSDMRRGDRSMPGPYQSEEGNRKHSEARKKPGFVSVTGLPYSASTAEVVEFFDSLEVAPNGIRFCLDNLRKKPNGNGFVKFVSEEDAVKACKLNMKHMGKRYIEVKRCEEVDWENCNNKTPPTGDYPSKSSKHGRRSRSHSPIRSLCIEMRGIPLHADVQHIKDFFYGLDLSTDKVFIMLNNDSIPTGTAYVEFPNQQMLEKAMRRNERYLGRQVIELKPILKEVMSARINDNKKQDRQSSNRSSSSTRESANSRGPGQRGSSRDSKYSSPRDRDSRESGSRSSRDQDLRQSSRSGRESQRGSDRESKPRDHDSRQNTARPKESPKDSSSRSSDPRSRYGRDETPQKRNGESKDQDSRRSSSASKPAPKEAAPKQPESAPTEEKPKPQPSSEKDPPPKSNTSPGSLPKPPAEVLGAVGKTEPPSGDDKSCINMRNMPFNTSDDEIHKFFEDMELQPLMVHFLITPEGRPNGQAYVEFANSADAHKAASRKDARIRDRNILMTIITKEHMQGCLAQGKPPPPSQGLLGLPRGPPFPHQPGNRPPMDFRPPLIGNQGPPFGMRNNPGPMRGPRPPPPIDVLIARGCVVETSNLPFDIPIPAIIDFFSNHNVIPESVRLKTNEHGRFSGEAMVAFRTAHDASRAIDDLSRSILGGRVLRLHLMQQM